MRKLSVVFVGLMAVLLLNLFGVALAAPSVPDKGPGYAQAGRAKGAVRNAVATADTDHAITAISTSPRPACWAWDSLLTWSPQGGTAVCVYTMTSSVGLGAVDGAGACHVSDPFTTVDGPGACFVVGNGQSRDKLPGFNEVYRRPGARRGICTVAVEDPGGRLVYPPCRVTADCTDAVGSGTCDTTAAGTARLEGNSCAFAVCKVDTDGTFINVEQDQ